MTRRNNRLDTTINLAELYDAVLEDIASEYPQDQLSFRRDSKRLHQQYSSRGQAFFTLDLPELDSALLRGLASGLLDVSTSPHSRGRTKRSMVPRLFETLWLRVFDSSGCLREDVDVVALRYLRQLLCMTKKAKVDYSQQSLFKTVKEFYNDESKLPPTPSFWDSSEDVHPNAFGHLTDLSICGVPLAFEPRDNEGQRELHLLESVQRICDRIAGALGTFIPSELRGRHGPGAVSELPESKYKYDFGIWSPNLEGTFDYEDFAVANASFIECSLSQLNISFHEEASRLIAVPKTVKGPRLIAAEPISHQWMQQAVANVLRDRTAHTLLRYSIDFFDQRPSQRAALEASSSGSYATIDLKSASDRLSCYVVQRVFRRNLTLMRMLRATRTRFLSNDEDSKEAGLLRLRKFATMGSALTFPVQSIVFAAVCLGVGAVKHPRLPLQSLARKVRVFGDDIVIPNAWVADTIRVLTLMGLQVNTSKSFWTGKFRESCGVDAYEGEDVTPTRIRGLDRLKLDSASLASMIDVTNNFHLRGYWRASAWILKTVPQMGNLPVVGMRAEMPGLLTFTPENRNENFLLEAPRSFSGARGADPAYLYLGRRETVNGSRQLLVPVRWNCHLQRQEVRLHVLLKKKRARPINTGSPGLLLQYFTERMETGIHMETSDLSAAWRQDTVLRESDNFRHLDHKWSSVGVISDRFIKHTEASSQPVVRLAWIPIEKWVG